MRLVGGQHGSSLQVNPPVVRAVCCAIVLASMQYIVHKSNEFLNERDKHVRSEVFSISETDFSLALEKTKSQLLEELLSDSGLISLDQENLRLTILGEEQSTVGVASSEFASAALEKLIESVPEYKAALAKGATSKNFWDVMPLLVVNDDEKFLPIALKGYKEKDPDAFSVGHFEDSGVRNLDSFLWSFRKFGLTKLRRLFEERQFFSCKLLTEYYLLSLQNFSINNRHVSDYDLGVINAIYLSALLFQRPEEVFYAYKDVSTYIDVIDRFVKNDEIESEDFHSLQQKIDDIKFLGKNDTISFFRGFFSASFGLMPENVQEKAKYFSQLELTASTELAKLTDIEISMVFFLRVRIKFWRAVEACQARPKVNCGQARADFFKAYDLSRDKVHLAGLERDVQSYKAELVRWKY